MFAQLSGWSPPSVHTKEQTFHIMSMGCSNDICTQMECENEAAESLTHMCKEKEHLC